MIYSDLIGIPFDEFNKDGVNCYELVRRAYEKHSITLPDTDLAVCACREVSNSEIQKHTEKYWEVIEKPESPCGVLILSLNPDFANHLGFYIGDGKILHTTKNTGSIIERMYPKYKNKILAFGRFIGDT